MEFKTDILKLFDKEWALVAAGTKDSFNMMTISWGMLGTIWGRPAATVYVRTSRYTHDFMDREGIFTVSFMPENMRDSLVLLGRESGRDIDKMHLNGLELEEREDAVVFKNAVVTLVCKKLFKQRVDSKNIPADILAKYYNGTAEHDMYIGEVIDVIYK